MKLLTVKETAKALSISPSLVYRLVSEGALRCYRIGRGALRFRQEDVEGYLNRCIVEVKLEPRRAPAAHLKHIRI
jgi:excisionase family DNA binding protein